MSSPQLFKFLTFVMVLLGTVSLLIFGHYATSPGTGLLVLVALFGGLFFWESRLHTPVWAFVWKLLSVVFVLYVLGDIMVQPLETAHTRVVKHAADLSIFLQLLKIYNRKTARDYKQMYLISLFQFVSCTTLTTSFGFFFLFGAYVLVSLWTLSLFHIRSHIEQYKGYRGLASSVEQGRPELSGKALRGPRRDGGRAILGPGYFGVTFGLAVVILLTALGMFFLFPRQQVAGRSDLWGRFRIVRATTGLSGEVELDRYGRISENSETVMRVTLPHARFVPQKVLWRAGALARFDGLGWQKGPADLVAPDLRLEKPFRVDAPQAGFYRPHYEYTPSRHRGLEADEITSLSEIWEQRITIKEGHALFLVSATSAPVLIGSSAPFVEEPMATFRFEGSPTTSVSCTVFSEFAPPSERTLEQAGLITDKEDPDGAVRAYYLASEPLSANSRAVLRDEIGIEETASPYEKIKAIESYLEKNYTYTLDLDRPARYVDPVENFLVITKRGHCEFFASAMTLMLQECGIPARLVYGYMTTGANWNRYFGGSFEIRQQDAHAWVEAALAIDGEVRWVPFDPSPREAVTPTASSALGQFFLGVSKFFEALKGRWHEWVVAFSSRHQHDIAARLQSLLREMGRNAAGGLAAAWERVTWVWKQLTRTPVTAVLTPVALACFVAAGVLLIHRRILRWIRFRRAYVENRPEAQVHTVRFYEQMLRALLQHDLVKPASQTPQEFVRVFEARGQLLPAVEGLTRLYYAVRFGRQELSGVQIRWVREALGSLRRGLGVRIGSERA